MRVLMHLNNLALGGAQLNALDFARTLGERGHHVTLFARGVAGPAPITERARAMDLDLVVAGNPDTPKARIRGVLTRLARERGTELLHAFEVPAARNCWFGPGRYGTLPIVTTFYGVRMLRGMPRHQPLMVGLVSTLGEAQGPFGHWRATLIEPPVDTAPGHDHPEAVDGTDFRTAHGIAPGEILLVIVTRLTEGLQKDRGVEQAVRAVRQLRDPRVRLAVIGDGESAPAIRAAAARTNEALGRPAVLVPGQMSDPRTAYAAADIVLGMGSSALRGLAFGKPLIVLGADGFARIHEPGEAVQEHAALCMYGYGGGDTSAEALAEPVRALAEDPARREKLGAWGRDWVVGRFALRRATDSLEALYQEALNDPPGRAAWLRDAEQMVRYDMVKPAGLRLLRRG